MEIPDAFDPMSKTKPPAPSKRSSPKRPPAPSTPAVGRATPRKAAQGPGQPPKDRSRVVLTPELVDIATLLPHPRNYRTHPEDQIAHVAARLREFGQYKNVVVARDWTILGGHGVVLAAQSIGMTQLLVVRLGLDPNSPQALKLLAGDNEVARLAENDDRLLTEMLKEIDTLDGLLGSVFDPAMLAALAMVTRPSSELANSNDAAQWAGMPEYEEGENPLRLVVSFRSAGDRKKFCEGAKLVALKMSTQTWSCWWPEKEIDDRSSVRFEQPTKGKRA
jgi:hypothetical protein